MARRAISIEEQIDRQEAVVIRLKKKVDDMKKQYDESVEKLAKLVDKKREIESKEILAMLKTTTRSTEEIKAFLRGEDPGKEEE